MHKLLAMLALIISTGLLLGQNTDRSPSTCMFLGIEPSSINLAIGGHDVGNVNIWHNSPLTSHSNPAMGAFREGVSYGFTKYDWLPDTDLGMVYHASMVNLGYQGLSITLPAYKFRNQSAIYVDNGLQYALIPGEDDPVTFNSYDTAGEYGLAVSIFDVADKYISDPFIKEHIDLAVGLNYIDILSYHGPDGEDRAHCWNLGTVGKFSAEYNKGIGFEGVFAHTNQNLFDNEMDFEIPGAAPERIWGRANTGFALGANLKTDNQIIDFNRRLTFCDNLLSARYLSSTSDDGDYRTRGYGVELGVLDTFFIRKGRYENYKGEVYGNTFGYGIDLHYKDLASLSWNYAEFPGGGLTNVQRSHDFNVSFDLLAILKN